MNSLKGNHRGTLHGDKREARARMNSNSSFRKLVEFDLGETRRRLANGGRLDKRSIENR